MRQYSTGSDRSKLSRSSAQDLSFLWSSASERVWSGSTTGNTTSSSSNRQEAASRRRTRKLEDLPMKYTPADSRMRMASQRSQRCQTAMSLKSCRSESIHLSSVGKKLFEDAVERATTTAGGRGSLEQSISTSTNTSTTSDSLQSFPNLSTSSASGHKRYQHNGPTTMGSPLYNKQDLELHNFRRESSSSKSTGKKRDAEFKKQMTRTASQFRVVPTSGVHGDKETPTYILVPLDEDKTLTSKSANEVIMPRTMLEGFHYKINSNSAENQNRHKVNLERYIRELLSNETDAVTSESSENPTAAEPKVKFPANQPGNQKVLTHKISKGMLKNREDKAKEVNQAKNNGSLAVDQNGNRSRPSSDCSSRSSRSTRSHRPCWVDNASITSYRPAEDLEGNPVDDAPSAGVAVPTNQTVLNGVGNLQPDGPTGQEKSQVPICQLELENDGNISEENVVSLQDLQAQKLSLPDFICPSSEEKSREAAVREWIEKSSFPWALRTVPLL